MKPKTKKPAKPKSRVYLVSFKVRTTERRLVLLTRADIGATWLCLDGASRLVMKPRVEEVGTR